MTEMQEKQTALIVGLVQIAQQLTTNEFERRLNKAIAGGGDPFVDFEFPKNSGIYMSGLETAISLQNKQAVDIFLNYARNKRVRVGLERSVPQNSSKFKTNKNLLQLARISCPQNIFDLLIEHAEYEEKEYGAPSPREILKSVIVNKTANKDGVLTESSRTTLGEELALSITSRTIMADIDLNIDDKVYTDKEIEILKSALNDWKTYHNDNVHEPKFKKEFAKLGSKGVCFSWSLNALLINDMVNNNLLDLDGRSSIDKISFSSLILAFNEDVSFEDKSKLLANLIEKNSKNDISIKIQQIEDIGEEKNPSTSYSSGSSTSKDADYIIVNMPLKNFFEEEPINVNVKISFTDLSELLQERVKNRRPSVEALKTITQNLVKNESESSEGMNRAAKESLNELSEANPEVIGFYNNLRALIKTEVSKMTTEKRKYFVENNVNIKSSLTAIKAITFAADLGLAAATSGASTALGSPISMLMSPMSVPLKRAADKKAEAVFDITVNEVHADEKIAIRIASAIAANMITTIQEVNPEEIKSLAKKVKAKAVVSFGNLKKGEDPLLQVVKDSHISIDQLRKKRNCLGM